MAFRISGATCAEVGGARSSAAANASADAVVMIVLVTPAPPIDASRRESRGSAQRGSPTPDRGRGASKDLGGYALRPNEVRAQTLVNGFAVRRLLRSRLRVEERVIGRVRNFRVTHQVRHDHANALLLVVEHDRRAALRAHTELERPLRILIVERLALQPGHVVDLEITVIE